MFGCQEADEAIVLVRSNDLERMLLHLYQVHWANKAQGQNIWHVADEVALDAHQGEEDVTSLGSTWVGLDGSKGGYIL